MIVSADAYLDRRQPEWALAERAGRVVYDRKARHVYVGDRDIVALHTPAEAR